MKIMKLENTYSEGPSTVKGVEDQLASKCKWQKHKLLVK